MPINTAQNMKFSITDFFIKCDQIHRKLRIWSHLLTKFLSEWVSIYSKPYIPILLTVCNNISMKNVIKRVKSVKLLNVKSLNC